MDCSLPADESNCDNSTRCEACNSCGAVLELDGCGHRFHPRCIFAWPATHCEVCDEPVTSMLVFRDPKNRSNSLARKGKWSIDEHKYANMLMKQFQVGALPLADGLHLRVFMANMLQCDPLRVTKKYAGQAIGKQNFFYKRNKTYCYNLHMKLQKQLSNLRNHYYWHVQYRCKFGPNLDIQELKAAEAEYWILAFCNFAKKIGQKVKFTNPSMPETGASNGRQSAVAATTTISALDTTPKSVLLPPVSSLLACVPSVEVEDDGKLPLNLKSEESSSAPSMKEILGLSSSFNQSPSSLSSGEWNDPSVFVDMALTDLSQGELSVTSSAKTPLTACAQESLKKGSWIGDWMKEAELEWSKGAISWSLSLSAEPLADFA